MASPKKFGAFAGVFTPSILTILGVIMYMRLGWVVGQAGLITAIGIILLAHLISVSTGLSISSIATDKKIKTGGIYYMLSRSLGLPMGGAIGITIFVGTALSISLYIIGFCENFLGIEMIRELTGLGNSINDYRILGSVVLLVLVIIAFISTSIALKTQFFILGAIALSLASVAIGFFTGDSGANGGNWMPAASSVSMTTVFAIFFPAVTGFTAGVAMSGDLKDPQKNIPFGTMSAIGVGFAVYISLALGFGMFVDRQVLLEDNNFLMKIAWSAPLVVAGIWGATLSSALGGILGGPRILQAMSTDRITPVVFGRGYGVNNEPRNALLLTFLIAEGGILIGELDVVAAIVSMFYIAAYGFINLAFALERWASADFRPTFRISKWVGIIGFAACFGVMFKLDTPIMFLAMIILTGIYFYIRKKKLELDFGDVWQSVWSSIARSILHQIDRKGLEERNWRPNIILFSGGTQNRPHLIQFGKDLVGNQGFLSNFDLILNPTSNMLFQKRQQSVADEITLANEGIFTRRQECKDIYEGIEAIASTYGFSGVEPNTVLFGWARQSEDPVRFARMIRALGELDLNILMMDYDRQAGFGKREIIDVWCRGGGNNCNLVLSLVKFMWMSENWKDARIRILMVNPINDEKEMLIKDVEDVLERIRMDAEIKIINNQIERRPIHDLIEVESSNSDLVFLGIPQIREGEEQDYVNQVNNLCQNVGTVVLVKASSYFKDLEIGRRDGMAVQDKTDYRDGEIDLVISRKIKIPEVSYPADPELEKNVRQLYESIKELNDEAFSTCLVDLFSLNRKVYTRIATGAGNKLADFSKGIPAISDHSSWRKGISGVYKEVFTAARDNFSQENEQIFAEQRILLDRFISIYTEGCSRITGQCPEVILKTLSGEDLKVRSEDKTSTILFKLRKKILGRSHQGLWKHKVRYRRLAASHLGPVFQSEIVDIIRNWGMISLQQTVKTQAMAHRIFDTYFFLNKLKPGQEAADKFNRKLDDLASLKDQIDRLNELSIQSLYTLIMNKTLFQVEMISRELRETNTSKFIRKNEKTAKQLGKELSVIGRIPVKWSENQLFLSNYSRLELELFTFIINAKEALSAYHDTLDSLMHRAYIDHLDSIMAASGHSSGIFYDTMTGSQTKLDSEGITQIWHDHTLKVIDKLREYLEVVSERITILDRAVFDNFKDRQFAEKRSVQLRARKLAEHILQGQFIDPIEALSNDYIEWLGREIRQTSEIIDSCRDLASMMKNDKSIASDLPQLSQYLAALRKQHSDAARNRIRFLNQLKERANALADKYSLHAMTRSAYIRKFLR